MALPGSLLSIAFAVIMAAIDLPPNSLVGLWQQQYADGRTALAVLRADSSVNFFLNGKAFSSGRYYVRQDTFGLSYASCNVAYYGVYRLAFFTPDSVRFAVIEDTCRQRQSA